MKRLHPAVHCRPAGDAGVSIIDTPLGTLRIREDPQVLVGRLPDSPDKAALVGFLEEEGIVVDDGPVLPDATLDEAGFLARRRPDPAAIGSLAVVGEGRIARSARARLTGWGCDVVDFIADHASAVLACSDREDHVFLLEANQTAIAAGVPITFCAVWRSTITLGPTVLPGETACYACFERRRHARLLHPTAHAALHRPPAVGELAAGPHAIGRGHYPGRRVGSPSACDAGPRTRWRFAVQRGQLFRCSAYKGGAAPCLPPAALHGLCGIQGPSSPCCLGYDGADR